MVCPHGTQKDAAGAGSGHDPEARAEKAGIPNKESQTQSLNLESGNLCNFASFRIFPKMSNKNGYYSANFRKIVRYYNRRYQIIDDLSVITTLGAKFTTI